MRDDTHPAVLETMTIGALMERFPFIATFLADEGLTNLTDELDWPLSRGFARHERENPALPAQWRAELLGRMQQFIREMLEFVEEDEIRIQCVTVRGGRDKDGGPEPVPELEVRAGEVLCIVGPTGSGKSRLLGDIEWVAQGDTPTGRVVLLNGAPPEPRWRFSTEHKLVAQLSQNMNFVVDLSVREFLAMHAESRRAPEHVTERIWQAAQELCGEPFGLDSPVTSLSGGQSRALMIADVAVLSRSPIVLIDEIENAGIDRRRALDVLIAQEKIVLMATHDPTLALYGDRRLVLRNGAMQRIITPSAKERENIKVLRELDARMMALRERLRRGELLEEL